MTDAAGAQQVLGDHALREHAARLYQNQDELADAVGDHLADGAERNEGLLVLARPTHAAAFRAALLQRGLDVAGLEGDGRLVMVDADQMLARLLTSGVPDRCKFQNIIGGILDGMLTAGRFTGVRAYGELVDILWQAGDLSGAIHLERLWNELLVTRSCTLLCGYRMTLLGDAPGVDAAELICNEHVHLQPAERRERLDAAVQHACHAVLGPRAADLHPLIAATVERSGRLERAEKTIFWMRRNLPGHAAAILAHARLHYEQAAR